MSSNPAPMPTPRGNHTRAGQAWPSAHYLAGPHGNPLAWDQARGRAGQLSQRLRSGYEQMAARPIRCERQSPLSTAMQTMDAAVATSVGAFRDGEQLSSLASPLTPRKPTNRRHLRARACCTDHATSQTSTVAIFKGRQPPLMRACVILYEP